MHIAFVWNGRSSSGILLTNLECQIVSLGCQLAAQLRNLCLQADAGILCMLLPVLTVSELLVQECYCICLLCSCAAFVLQDRSWLSGTLRYRYPPLKEAEGKIAHLIMLEGHLLHKKWQNQHTVCGVSILCCTPPPCQAAQLRAEGGC